MKQAIALGDKSNFELFIGTRVLKSQVFNSKGKIPLYSANVFEPFGYLENSNISDFKHNYLLWGIDGDFKFNIMKKGTVFATTDHCGAIRILNEKILPEYLLYELELKIQTLSYDRTLRPSLTVMERDVKVNIPVDNSGIFGVIKQKEIITKYMKIKKIKRQLQQEAEELQNISVKINFPSESTMVLSVQEIFDLDQSTNSSKFTKAFVNQHKGEIPVYSASKDPDEISYGHVQDNLSGIKYFSNILTWNIDGSIGKAFFRNGRFTLSEKVIPLVLRSKWKDLIDVLYVKYVLESKAIEEGLGYTNKAGKGRIRDLQLDIPCNLVDGVKQPNIIKQKELAKEYHQIQCIKQKLVSIVSELRKAAVEI